MPEDTVIPNPSEMDPKVLKALEDVIAASEKLAMANAVLAKSFTGSGTEASKSADKTKRLAEEQKKQGTETKRTANQTLLLVASYQALTFATTRAAKTLTDTVRGQVAYRLEQQRTASVIMSGIKTQEAQVAALQKMQTQLKLTREQAQEFFKVWRAGAPLGLDPKQITKVTDELQKMLGVQAGRQMAARLPELAEAAGGGGVVMGQIRGAKTERQLLEATAGMDLTLGEMAATIRGAEGIPAPAGALQQKSDMMAAADMQIDNIKQLFADFSTSLFSSPLFITGPIALSAAASGIGNLLTLQQAYQQVFTVGQQGRLAAIQTNTAAAAVRGGGGGMPLVAGGGGKAPVKGGFLRGAGRFAGKAGPIAMIAGLAGELGGGALRQAGEEEMRRTGGRGGEGMTRGGAGVQAAGGVAGMAGTGAMLGSMLGPWGALGGAVLGGAVGIWQEWGNISKALFGVTKEMENAKKLSKTAREVQHLHRLELQKLRAETEKLPSLLARAWKNAEHGLAQYRGTAAEAALALAEPAAAPPERIGELTRKAAQGKQEQLAQWLRVMDFDERINLLNGRIARETNPERKRLLQMRVQSLQTQRMLAEKEVAEAFSVAVAAERLNKALELRLELTKVQVSTINTEIDTFGLIMGDTSKLTSMLEMLGELRAAEATATEKNVAELKKTRDAAIKAARETMKGTDQADAIRRAEREFRVAEARAKQRLAEATAQYIKGITSTIERIAMTAFEQAGFRLPEARRGLAEARLAAGRARGLAPAEAGAMAGQVAAQARAQAAFLISTEERDLAKASAALAAELREITDPQERRKIQLEAEISSLSRMAKTQEAVAMATERSTAAATAALEKEREIIDVVGSRLSAEMDIANVTGASFKTIFSIQQEMVGLDRQRLMNMQQQMANLQDTLGPWHPKVLSLQTQMAQKQADIVKRSVGLQRDFLDKALGRMFGMGGGTRFQPITHDRFALGEFGVMAGIKRAGGGLNAQEQQRQMGALGVGGVPLQQRGGAQRAQIPIGGRAWGGGVAGPPPESRFQPVPGVFQGRGQAVPLEAGGGGQRQMTDVSGRIQISIDLKTDMLDAKVEKKVINMNAFVPVQPGRG